MISRLILSLKKALRVREGGWTPDVLLRTHIRTVIQTEFECPLIGPQGSYGITSDKLEPSDLSERQVRKGSSGSAV